MIPRGGRFGLAILLSMAALAWAHADERILSFKSTLRVQPDGDLLVREDIRVRAEGREIRHGIYRDFPTEYVDAHGLAVHIRFHVNNIQCDGSREDSHSQPYANGVRTYIGKRSSLVEPGEHSYTIEYQVDRELGFFDDHDELYWNVTGNGWRFPIDHAEAFVELPDDARAAAQAAAAFTGAQCERGNDFGREETADGRLHFWTTRALGLGEGLTIVATWPTGFIQRPGLWHKLRWILADNQDIAIASVGILVVLGYFLLVWSRVGRDPDAGVIIPRYVPPDHWTPGFMRFVEQEGWDDKIFAATLLSLAVKGYIKILQSGSDYSIEKTEGSQQPLEREEARLLNDLLGKRRSLPFQQTNHLELEVARNHLQDALRARADGTLFVTNLSWWGYGVLISILFIVATLLASDNYSVVLWPLAAILVALNVVFLKLLPRPTASGRQVMDVIEGFRLYLSVAEKDRMNLLNPPERTPQLFERYLPYALALDVEQRWADQFAAVLALTDKGSNGGGVGTYSPSWYYGPSWGLAGPGYFAQAMSHGFTQSITAAATPPGSSSGAGGGFSGGGGSSGGGGGGGGGGGW